MNRSATTDSGNSLDGQLVSAHDPIMDTTADIMLLYRIDPSRNMARFYRLSIQPTLLGGSSLVRNWGQIGTDGRLIVELYDMPEEADTAFERVIGRKLRRSYRYDDAPRCAQEIVTPKGAKTASAGFVATATATPAEWSPVRTICSQRAWKFLRVNQGSPSASANLKPASAGPTKVHLFQREPRVVQCEICGWTVQDLSPIDCS